MRILLEGRRPSGLRCLGRRNDSIWSEVVAGSVEILQRYREWPMSEIE